MTTSKQYDESEGTFEGGGMSDSPCRTCGGNKVKYSIWESSDGAYEDYKYTCMSCGVSWWVDGIDS